MILKNRSVRFFLLFLVSSTFTAERKGANFNSKTQPTSWLHSANATNAQAGQAVCSKPHTFLIIHIKEQQPTAALILIHTASSWLLKDSKNKKNFLLASGQRCDRFRQIVHSKPLEIQAEHVQSNASTTCLARLPKQL